MTMVHPAELEQIEMALLLEGIHRRYGHDLSGYADKALAAPIRRLMRSERVSSLSGLTNRLLRRPECMNRLLKALSGSPARAFHDPGFYLTLRARVVPVLRTYPSIRIWVAGCGDGGEMYSLAIMLREERLDGRCDLFATDLDEELLHGARAGRFPLSDAERCGRDYRRAGGLGLFDDHYTRHGSEGVYGSELSSRVVFGTHSPVTDGPFNEFHLILCRTAWPLFGRALQQRVSTVIHRSLGLLGFVVLGPGEGIAVSPHADCYEEFSPEHGIHRRMR